MIFRRIYVFGLLEDLLDKHFPDEKRPSLLDLERNDSLVFDMGSPFLLNGWSPMAPNHIQIGK